MVDSVPPTADPAAAASERVKELENLNLNFVSGISGTFTQDLLQHLIKQDAVHKAFEKRRKEGLEASQRLADAVEGMQLTGGLMFKVRHV